MAMTAASAAALPPAALLLPTALAFSPAPLPSRRVRAPPSTSALFARAAKDSATKKRYAPSVVTDPHGPTPEISADPFPEVEIDTLPENHYDPDNHPVPHQPWRRGDTDGCHDPINAPWRVEAEDCIQDAARLVGCEVVDVTWYMAKCVISLDEKSLSNVVSYVDGPEVRIVYPDESDVSGHVWKDPEAGTEEEMFTEEDELLDYEQYDEDTEYEILKASMPTEYDEVTGEELPPREPRGREERAMELREEWEGRFLDEPRTERPNDGMFAHPVDTKALSVVSQAITTALADDNIEERLRILSRHDVMLTSPLDNPCILDSQREFDDARDLDVYVETRDPWGSNRVLGGKLVDRNALDVIINQDNTGRMVTIPHSMIHQVLLPSGLAKGSARAKAGFAEDGDEEDDDDADEGDGEDGGGYLEVEEEEVFE
ncbi:hypothetical protein ACHAWF_009233 [Thalassiosira exigua]